MEKLVCIVTGMEHSGTTYLSRIFNSHSDIFSGFETGILIAPLAKFTKVEPFQSWISHGGGTWGLPTGASKKISKMTSYNEAYRHIFENKGSYGGKQQQLIKDSKYLVDKTPSYYRHPEILLSAIPDNIPIFTIVKTFENIYNSHMRRCNNATVVKKRIHSFVEFLKYIKNSKSKRTYLVSYEELINNKKEKLEKLESIFYEYNPHLRRESLSEEKFKEKILDIKEDYTYKNWKKSPNKHLVPKDCYPLKEEYERLINELTLI